MKAILTYYMALEFVNNEQQIKNKEGAYRPRLTTLQKIVNGRVVMYQDWVAPIKCWPFKDLSSLFIQERDVIEGMEEEVYDVSMAVIDKGYIKYMTKDNVWSMTEDILDYSILIYSPKFSEQTIFITAKSLNELFKKCNEYRLFTKYEFDENVESFGEYVENEFKKYTGICTYILFKGDSIINCGQQFN